VVKVTRHPSWVSYYKNDIGLVQVQNPLPVSPAVAGTVLPSKGWKVTLVGYGRVKHDVKPDGVKRKAVNTIENVNVADKYFTTVGTSDGEGNSLTGDSGGPVLVSINGKEVVVGVISTSQDYYGTKSFHVTINPFISWLVASSGGDFYRPPKPNDGSGPPTDSGSSPETASDLDPETDADIDATATRREIYDDGCSMGNGSPPLPLPLIILLYLLRIRRKARCQRNP
jgi:MYXO-CTERM domain-containing protein